MMKLTDNLQDYANMPKTVIIIITDMHNDRYWMQSTEDSQLDHIKLTASTVISKTICSWELSPLVVYLHEADSFDYD
jgi:hypothetical protein